MTPRFAPVALCTTECPGRCRLYTEAFGFADAGGKAPLGGAVARMQGLGDDTSLRLLVARRAPGPAAARALPPYDAVPARGRRPGAERPTAGRRFGITVPDFDPALERLAALGIELLSEPLDHEGLRRACFRDPYTGVIVEVLEEGADHSRRDQAAVLRPRPRRRLRSDLGARPRRGAPASSSRRSASTKSRRPSSTRRSSRRSGPRRCYAGEFRGSRRRRVPRGRLLQRARRPTAPRRPPA